MTNAYPRTTFSTDPSKVIDVRRSPVAATGKALVTPFEVLYAEGRNQRWYRVRLATYARQSTAYIKVHQQRLSIDAETHRRLGGHMEW
jgi:hypothetical protein